MNFGSPRKDTSSTCDKLTIVLENKDIHADKLIKNQQEKGLHFHKAKVI